MKAFYIIGDSQVSSSGQSRITSLNDATEKEKVWAYIEIENPDILINHLLSRLQKNNILEVIDTDLTVIRCVQHAQYLTSLVHHCLVDCEIGLQKMILKTYCLPIDGFETTITREPTREIK